MAEFAVSFLDSMQGTLSQLAVPISTDMHIRNVSAHVRNGLYHAKRTPEIDTAAQHLVSLAQDFGRRHSAMPLGQQQKSTREEDIERMRAAYLTLRKLLEAAEPSEVSRALGG